MVNKFRGEVIIKSQNKEFILRPTFQALCEIEGSTNKTIFELIESISSRALSIEEQVNIIKAGAKAAGTILEDNIIGLIIEENGLFNVLKILVKFLKNSVGINNE